jgi:hypothetical protein
LPRNLYGGKGAQKNNKEPLGKPRGIFVWQGIGLYGMVHTPAAWAQRIAPGLDKFQARTFYGKPMDLPDGV